MDAAVDAIIIIDGRGIIQQCSGSAQALFGYSAPEMLGKNVSMLMPEPDASHHDEYLDNYKRTGDNKIIGIGRNVRGRKSNGDTFPMHLSVGESTLNGEHLFVGICHDLTQYQTALQQLARAEQRYKDIVETQKQFILRIDRDFRVTFANASFTRALGAGETEIIGKPITVFVNEPGHHIRDKLACLFEDEGTSEEISVKISMHGKNGSRTLVDWNFRRTPSESDEKSELQGFGIDVSEQERAIEQAHYFRTHDPLTGLLNKQTLLERCKTWFSKSDASALLYLDLEHFSLINQRLGNERGDAVLIKIASRLNSAVKRDHLIARSGSDKFLIAVHVSSRDDAQAVAEQINDALSQPFRIDSEQLDIRGTVGIAIHPWDSQRINVLPELAESAKGSARRHNLRVGVFNFEHHRDLHRQIEIEQGLKEAIQRDHLEIYLQPKYCVSTRQISGFEALARWRHPEKGFISPGEFVPIAEKSSLGIELDRYVLSEVINLISGARARRADFPAVAVNITPAHFAQENFANMVVEKLKQAGIPTASIELEITEGAVMEKSAIAHQNLETLREHGVRIAIDDFGTGYSSLNYLRHLRIDDLKIDKTFIDEIRSPKGRVIVESVIRIADAYQIKVTAEGVETADQLEDLRTMGCHFCQGYLLSRPLPAAEAIALMHS